MMRRTTFKCVSLLLISYTLLVAQNLTGAIAGLIVDEVTQQLLPGVNILIQGTEIGTASDDAGRFLLLDLLPGS